MSVRQCSWIFLNKQYKQVILTFPSKFNIWLVADKAAVTSVYIVDDVHLATDLHVGF